MWEGLEIAQHFLNKGRGMDKNEIVSAIRKS